MVCQLELVANITERLGRKFGVKQLILSKWLRSKEKEAKANGKRLLLRIKEAGLIPEPITEKRQERRGSGARRR